MKKILVLEKPVKNIKNADDIFTKIKKINIDYSKENVIIFGLDTKNNIKLKENMFIGGINSCIVDPRIIFKKLLLRGCVSFIMSHNHPSGDLTPSPEDIDIHNQLCEAGEILYIKCLDSIIFNKKNYYVMTNYKRW